MIKIVFKHLINRLISPNSKEKHLPLSYLLHPTLYLQPSLRQTINLPFHFLIQTPLREKSLKPGNQFSVSNSMKAK